MVNPPAQSNQILFRLGRLQFFEIMGDENPVWQIWLVFYEGSIAFLQNKNGSNFYDLLRPIPTTYTEGPRNFKKL